jgi:hypothetical protein
VYIFGKLLSSFRILMAQIILIYADFILKSFGLAPIVAASFCEEREKDIAESGK